jgi:predicted metalloprotease with PDZ domain
VLDKADGVIVQNVRRDSAAAQAGLSANDVIIAIDGIKASEKLLAKYAKQKGSFIVYAFRRDELLQFELHAGENPLNSVELKVEDQTKLEVWLKG